MLVSRVYIGDGNLVLDQIKYEFNYIQTLHYLIELILIFLVTIDFSTFLFILQYRLMSIAIHLNNDSNKCT